MYLCILVGLVYARWPNSSSNQTYTSVRFPCSFDYWITLVKAQRENVPQQAIKGHLEKEMPSTLRIRSYWPLSIPYLVLAVLNNMYIVHLDSYNSV